MSSTISSVGPGAMLLDASTATEVFAQAEIVVQRATPTYVRFKPGENLLIGFDFETANGPARGYTVSCVDQQRADELFAKASTLRPRPTTLGSGIARLGDRTVFYGFPNDARLRQLRWYVVPRKLKRSLASLFAGEPRGSTSSATVLRYKPERRVVVDATLGSFDAPDRRVFVRYSSRRQAGQLAAIAATLRHHGVSTPRPIAQLDHDRVSVDEFVEGVVLRDCRAGSVDGGVDGAVNGDVDGRGDGGVDAGAIASGLRRFHAAVIPQGMPTRRIIDDLTSAAAALTALAVWAPTLRPGIDRTVSGIARCQRSSDETASAPDWSLIHGDLHDRNLMIDGSQVHFVDLERVSVGEIETDLGCLLGTAIAHHIRPTHPDPAGVDLAAQVIDSYRAGGGRCDPQRLRAATAVALIDQAILVSRHLLAGWSDTASVLLARAAEELR